MIRLLRFIGIMDGSKLSITCIGMYVMLGIMIHIAWASPENSAANIAAVAAFLTNTANYMHKRKCHADSGNIPTT